MSQPALRIVEGSSMDKSKALTAALSQIERQFGKGSIMRLGKNDKSMDIEVISSGSLGLDIALGVGGLPRGRVVEIYGPESSGKTTLALHTIAEAQKLGGICAFVDAELARIDRIERMFGIDEGADAAIFLRFGQNVQRQRGLARRFGPIDFDDAAARQPTDAERDIEAERAGGDGIHIHRPVVLAEPHDRALAKAALDLGKRRIKGLRFIHGRSFNETKRCCTCTHDPCSLWPGIGRPATKRPLPRQC